MRKAVVLVCVLSLLASAAMLLGCGSSENTSTAATPEEVAETFWNASLKGDADASWALLSKSIKEGLGDKSKWEASVRNDPNASVVAGKATIDGDSATVKVSIKSSGKEVMTSDVSLVKEDGAWKVELP